MAKRRRFSEEPFGATVERLMEETGLTYRSLADKSGLSAGYLNHVVHGNRPVPANDVIGRLAAAFDVVPEHFLEVRIRAITERWKSQGHHIVIYPDASGKNRKSNNASTSDIAQLQQAGFEVRAKPSNPAVKDRVSAMNKALESCMVMVNEQACPDTARCLEQQAYDKNGEPDKGGGSDHQNDASTYPIAYEMPVVKPVINIPVRFAL